MMVMDMLVMDAGPTLCNNERRWVWRAGSNLGVSALVKCTGAGPARHAEQYSTAQGGRGPGDAFQRP